MAITYAQPKPTHEHYALYCRLVLEGKDDEAIRAELRLSRAVYKKYQPFFLMHFREHARKTFRKRATRERRVPAGLIPLTPERRKKFLAHVARGLDFARAAALLNVPLPCVTEGWFKQDPLLQEEARFAAERATAEVEMALHRSAVGFEHGYQISNSSHVTGIGKDGPIDKTTETTTTGRKRVYPNVRAQELWLTNRDPDRWKPTTEDPDPPPPAATINVYGDGTRADLAAFVASGEVGAG